MTRMKEYQDRAAAKGTKRVKTSRKEGCQQHEPEDSTARMEGDAPASSSSCNGNVAPAQSSSSSGSTTRTNGHEGGDRGEEATKKRKAEEGHSEDPGRDDGK